MRQPLAECVDSSSYISTLLDSSSYISLLDSSSYISTLLDLPLTCFCSSFPS